MSAELLEALELSFVVDAAGIVVDVTASDDEDEESDDEGDEEHPG